MPTISMFYGIIITMYYNDHQPPHLHATYNDKKACFNFDGEIIIGDFPKKQRKLVEAWIELHRDELLANWTLIENNSPIYKIKPLD
ncbi:MAG: DUF4160 domain-containing protein [Ruminococcus sp.]|nr:DUF4160 domain-containing protein [Ruminococcus sp.]